MRSKSWVQAMLEQPIPQGCEAVGAEGDAISVPRVKNSGTKRCNRATDVAVCDGVLVSELDKAQTERERER